VPPTPTGTRVDFLHFFESVLWKTREVPQFTFPIVRVLPGTLFRVLKTLPVPVHPTPVPVEVTSPRDEEQGSGSQDCSSGVLPALPASSDISPSHVLEVASPSYSLVPDQCPPLDIAEFSPYDKEPSPTSHGLLPDYPLVLPEDSDC